jgi:hypothetical protein
MTKDDGTGVTEYTYADACMVCACGGSFACGAYRTLTIFTHSFSNWSEYESGRSLTGSCVDGVARPVASMTMATTGFM